MVSEPPSAWVVDAAFDRERLDRWLAAVGDDSRSTYQRWIRDGRVSVNGAVETSAKATVRAGQRVEVRPAPPPPSTAIPEAIPIEVLYEDEHLVVVDKAPFMVVHPAPGHPRGTLVNALLHHFGVLPGDDPARPGIVHRLDALTSGVMVVARTPSAREGLSALFARHDIDRVYLALVLGEPPSRVTYDTLHGRHPVHRKRFSSRVIRGKRAVTHVALETRLHGSALISCRLETGRTHQIRVHLADHGFPLLGDPMYGRRVSDERLATAQKALGRQALHATRLGFVHPITGAPLSFETPPPADFQAALDALGTEVSSG